MSHRRVQRVLHPSRISHERVLRVSAFSPITRPNIPSYLHQDWCLHKKLPRKKKIVRRPCQFCCVWLSMRLGFLLEVARYFHRFFFSSPFSWQPITALKQLSIDAGTEYRYQSQRVTVNFKLSRWESSVRTNYRSISKHINITLTDQCSCEKRMPEAKWN